MASAEFDENSEEKRPTVQVGDPFTERKLMDLCQRLTPMHYETLFPLFTLPLTLLRNKKPLKGLPSISG